MRLDIDWQEPPPFRITLCVREGSGEEGRAPNAHNVLATTFRSSNAHQSAYTFTICHIAAGYSSGKMTPMTSSL